MIAPRSVSPFLGSDLNETLNRSKLIEAQQKELIKQRLLNSRPTGCGEQWGIPKIRTKGSVNVRSNTINRSRVPLPLNFDESRQKCVTVSIKTAPICSMAYSKLMLMGNMMPPKYIPVRNVYNNSIVMVPAKAAHLIPRSAYFSRSQLQMSYVYKDQQQLAVKKPAQKANLLRSKVGFYPASKITKTTLASKASKAGFFCSKAAKFSAVKAPISATSCKGVSAPFVADVFDNRREKKTNRLAPFVSQPLSARGEYFAFSNFDIEDDDSENDENRTNKDVKHDSVEELLDDDVEDHAIEDDAVENTENANSNDKEALHSEIKLGSHNFSFEMQKTAGNNINSKVIFLNHCHSIWNKFIETK